MPLEIREFSARLIELFIRVLAVESGMDLKTMGSTTLAREALDRSGIAEWYGTHVPEGVECIRCF